MFSIKILFIRKYFLKIYIVNINNCISKSDIDRKVKIVQYNLGRQIVFLHTNVGLLTPRMPRPN